MVSFSNADFSVIRRACLEAGRAIMEIYSREDFGMRVKSDNSPLTDADLAADRIIYEALHAQFPGEVIIAEERAESHGARAQNFFIVDPLDGTKEFLKRGGDFTVNIGYVEAGNPVFGMVYAPAISRLFYTQGGAAVEEIAQAGAQHGFSPDMAGEVKVIQTRASDNDALEVIASKSHRDAATDEYIARYKVAGFASAGSSLKFCLIASGEADLYPRLGPTMEWDTAAADALIRAAGGETLNFDTLAPLAYGKEGFKNPFFIVKSKHVALIS